MSSRESRAVVRGSAHKRSRSKDVEPPKMSSTSPLRILLLGKSVSENSRVGNLILGRSAFDSEAPPDVVERVGGRLKYRHVTLINSPQLLHTHISDDQITQTVRECVSLSDPGPHVVLLLLQHQQCSAEDQERVEKLQNSFSERLLQHTLVLSTQEPTEPNQILQKIIQKCSNRHVSLQTSSSADHLLQAFEDIERSNEGRHLITPAPSGESLREQFNERLREERERMEREKEDLQSKHEAKQNKMKIQIEELNREREELRKKLEEKERMIMMMQQNPEILNIQHKKREGEFRKMEEECVKLIKEVQKQNKQLKWIQLKQIQKPEQKLKREEQISELYRIDQSPDSKLITDFEKDGGTHVATVLGCNSPWLGERGAGKVASEKLDFIWGGPSFSSKKSSTVTQDIAVDSVPVCKIPDTVYNTPGLSSTCTTGRIHQKKESFQGFSNLKKMASETESQRLEHTPVSRLSSRRIVLLGKTDVGKSAAGNTILGQKKFSCQTRTPSVTRVCSEAQATVSGRSVSVVDTPGFFDPQMTHEQLITEISRSLYISSPGPHAFLIVFPLNMRFTEQELQIPQMIELMFGEGVLKYSIILFTHGDQLYGESVEKLIKQNSRLRYLVQQCGGRYHVFNNRDEDNREQVEDLLQKIDSMIQQNGGAHYTNQMYEDAHRFRQRNEDGGGFFEFLDKYWPYFVAAAITVILAIIGGPHKLAFFAGIVSAIAATFSTTNAGKTKQQ